MRYASYALIAMGGIAMGYLQLAEAQHFGSDDGTQPLPMLFSAATFTLGLLLLTLSQGPKIESPA